MIASKAKNTFWKVVKECLVEMHGLSKTRAREKVKILRDRIKEPPEGMSSEIFYHAEPFDVACDIAEHQLDISDYCQQYDQILESHNW